MAFKHGYCSLQVFPQWLQEGPSCPELLGTFLGFAPKMFPIQRSLLPGKLGYGSPVKHCDVLVVVLAAEAVMNTFLLLFLQNPQGSQEAR